MVEWRGTEGVSIGVSVIKNEFGRCMVLGRCTQACLEWPQNSIGLMAL